MAGIGDVRRGAIETGLSSETLGLADLADQLAEMSTAHVLSAHQGADGTSAALTAVLDALSRIREVTGPEAVIAAAPAELVATALFDRVMWSQVRGSTWRPQAVYAVDADGKVTLEIDVVSDRLEIPLASPLVEAEAVRRRLPALVNDAPSEPRTYAPLVRSTGTRDYVVAPLVAESSVIGLLHADRKPGRSPVAELDRDLLRMFADGVGVIYERAILAERAEQQRRSVAEVCDAAARALTQLDVAPRLDLNASPPSEFDRPPVQPVRDRVEGRESSRLARLTAREREVLGLLASGATNAQLADRLTVAESTVKSHVKHILHKLGAGNRAAAIACYLRETRLDERRPR